MANIYHCKNNISDKELKRGMCKARKVKCPFTVLSRFDCRFYKKGKIIKQENEMKNKTEIVFTKAQWRLLEWLWLNKFLSENKLLKITEGQVICPEWWDIPCNCWECVNCER